MSEFNMLQNWRARCAVARRNRRLFRPRRLLRPRTQVDEFLLVPSDLRPPDPSFLDELKAGYFGLASGTVAIGGRSPFAIEAMSDEWLADLHGFAWLNHLSAASEPEASDLARHLVHDWLARTDSHQGIVRRGDVVARRVISWISHSALLLEGTDVADYMRVVDKLGAEIEMLDGEARKEDPYRLPALIALVLAQLAIKGLDDRLDQTERRLTDALGGLILADGGHISRNPQLVLELVLDMLPLRQCYFATKRALPPTLMQMIQRMIRFMRFMRLGDGNLTHFNGAQTHCIDSLSTVLLFDTDAPVANGLTESRYARIEASTTVLVMDCGTAPPLTHSGQACAGALSFELSDAATAVFINGILTPHQRSARSQLVCRATSSHNTLCLNEQWSAQQLSSRPVVDLCRAMGLAGPDNVTAAVASTTDGHTIEASHDGYMQAADLIHSRKLSVSSDGRRIDGIDRLAPQRGILRLKQDLPLAVHFHLAPLVEAELSSAASFADIRLPDGRVWRMQANGAAMSLEASRSGPSVSASTLRQIVLRATCSGEATVAWQLERINPS